MELFRQSILCFRNHGNNQRHALNLEKNDHENQEEQSTNLLGGK